MEGIRTLSERHQKELLPKASVKLYRDKNYIFGAIGLISTVDFSSAKDLLKSSFEELGDS
jgi:hypothetical protein